MDKAIEIIQRRLTAVSSDMAKLNGKIFLAKKNGEETAQLDALHHARCCAFFALSQALRELELTAMKEAA